MKKTMMVDGMSCVKCSSRISASLPVEIEEVKAVEINLDEKTVTVTLESDVDNAILAEAIEDMGFDVLGFK